MRNRSTFGRRTGVAITIGLAVTVAACGSGDGSSNADSCLAQPDLAAVERSGVAEPTTITMVTHDAFAISEGTLEAFTAESGISVELLISEDAGTLVTQAALTAGEPIADVLYGIDNTFLCRGLQADVFLPYSSPALSSVPDELQLDPHRRVTPIDFGDVCVNTWPDELDGQPPASIDELTDPANRGRFVTQNPETSSPGMAFLLATIAKYGDGWEAYWEALVANELSVTNGWTDAYYGEFIAGGGSRSIVTSYATSPVADVVLAEPPTDQPNIDVITDGCFRQIEFAGILNGTDHPEAAAALIDFMLSDTFQNDVPLNMFVFPASTAAEPPSVFLEHAAAIPAPLSLDPVTIEANRSEWTERWNEIVLG